DLLAGGQALEDLRADRPLTDAGDEVLDDLVVDVSLEEAQPDLAHGGLDVGLADAATAGQVAERPAQSLAQAVEHGWSDAPCGLARSAPWPIGWCAGSDAPRPWQCSARSGR